MDPPTSTCRKAFLKLTTDGSVLGHTGIGGAGGLRNLDGRWIKALFLHDYQIQLEYIRIVASSTVRSTNGLGCDFKKPFWNLIQSLLLTC